MCKIHGANEEELYWTILSNSTDIIFPEWIDRISEIEILLQESFIYF